MIILGERALNEVLNNLQNHELGEFQSWVGDALAEYSRAPNSQPPRTVFSTDEGVHMFMPGVSRNAVGVKAQSGTSEGFKGSNVIMERNGLPKGIVNSTITTAFRTALATSLAWRMCFDDISIVQEMTCFGAGLQAYWHIKLALYMFSHMKIVWIWNRTHQRAEDLAKRLTEEYTGKNAVRFFATEHPSRKVGASQVICCCTPSKEPVIKRSWLSQDVSNLFISMIGSYKPDMREVDSGIMALSQGKIVVDSKEATLEESGEFIENGIKEDQLVEIGDLWGGREPSPKISSSKVILWKCVGLSVMDLSASAMIIRKAEEAGIGLNVDFE